MSPHWYKFKKFKKLDTKESEMPSNKCRGMIKLENYHLANITVIIDSDKEH